MPGSCKSYFHHKALPLPCTAESSSNLPRSISPAEALGTKKISLTSSVLQDNDSSQPCSGSPMLPAPSGGRLQTNLRSDWSTRRMLVLDSRCLHLPFSSTPPTERILCFWDHSLRYHRLHPEYIHQRIEHLGLSYNLRIFLFVCDIVRPLPFHSPSLLNDSQSEHQEPIRELTRVTGLSSQQHHSYRSLVVSPLPFSTDQQANDFTLNRTHIYATHLLLLVVGVTQQRRRSKAVPHCLQTVRASPTNAHS